MQFPFDDSWGVSNRLPGWIYVASPRAIRFDHKGGSGKMVCCWQGLVKRRRSADKRLVWIRLIVVDTIACETILFHDYWMVFWMVQTNMFFSGVLQCRCGGCRSGFAHFDWCDMMVWLPFLKVWSAQALRFWHVKYVLNVCWLYVSCLFPLVAENESNLSQGGATFHAFPATMGFDHSVPRKLPVDPLSLTKEQKEKLSAPGPGWLLGFFGAKLWEFQRFSRTQTAWWCLMQSDAHWDSDLNMRRIPW